MKKPVKTSTSKGSSKAAPRVIVSKYRSRLEERGAAQLEAAGISFHYEKVKLKYRIPERMATYTPDFPTGELSTPHIILEYKGRFRTASERQKLVLVREHHPHIDLRIIFQKASLPIYKGSPTTHGQWATAHGIPWADNGVIPNEWIEEMKAHAKSRH